MESLYTLLLVSILLELFEVQWQKADTLMGMLLRMYQRYQKNMLLFLVMHPTFYFAIWLMMVTDASYGAIALLFVKTIDIATKIMLIQQVFEKKEISQEISMMLLAPLKSIMPYLGVFVYPPMVYMAFVF